MLIIPCALHANSRISGWAQHRTYIAKPILAAITVTVLYRHHKTTSLLLATGEVQFASDQRYRC
jgi:hypothetical protein